MASINTPYFGTFGHFKRLGLAGAADLSAVSQLKLLGRRRRWTAQPPVVQLNTRAAVAYERQSSSNGEYAQRQCERRDGCEPRDEHRCGGGTMSLGVGNAPPAVSRCSRRRVQDERRAPERCTLLTTRLVTGSSCGGAHAKGGNASPRHYRRSSLTATRKVGVSNAGAPGGFAATKRVKLAVPPDAGVRAQASKLRRRAAPGHSLARRRWTVHSTSGHFRRDQVEVASEPRSNVGCLTRRPRRVSIPRSGPGVCKLTKLAAAVSAHLQEEVDAGDGRIRTMDAPGTVERDDSRRCARGARERDCPRGHGPGNLGQDAGLEAVGP